MSTEGMLSFIYVNFFVGWDNIGLNYVLCKMFALGVRYEMKAVKTNV